MYQLLNTCTIVHLHVHNLYSMCVHVWWGTELEANYDTYTNVHVSYWQYSTASYQDGYITL